MDILKLAQTGFKLFAEGREALSKVTAAIADGTAAISEDKIEDLKAMLQKEKGETREAVQSAHDAIAAYRASGEA